MEVSSRKDKPAGEHERNQEEVGLQFASTPVDGSGCILEAKGPSDTNSDASAGDKGKVVRGKGPVVKPNNFKNLGKHPYPGTEEMYGPGYVEIVVNAQRILRAPQSINWVPEDLLLHLPEDYHAAW